MAVLAMTSCRVELNAVDMSQYVAAVELTLDGVELDTTDFASGGWEEKIMGLKSASLKVKFNDDFASTTVDDRVYAFYNTGTPVAFKIRPTSAAIATTNPSYEGSFLPNSFTAVAGSVGDLATKDLTWPVTGAVSRVTA